MFIDNGKATDIMKQEDNETRRLYLEVKPLMVIGSVGVGVQDQIVLVLSDL